ncbi:hypothetical protein Tco_0110489 [Tanacetum coccineum]
MDNVQIVNTPYPLKLDTLYQQSGKIGSITKLKIHSGLSPSAGIISALSGTSLVWHVGASSYAPIATRARCQHCNHRCRPTDDSRSSLSRPRLDAVAKSLASSLDGSRWRHFIPVTPSPHPVSNTSSRIWRRCKITYNGNENGWDTFGWLWVNLEWKG